MNTSHLFVHGFSLGPWKNRLYLIGNRDAGSCVVVDPAWNVEMILDEARGQDVQINHILCTHSHRDHTDGVDALQAKTGASVHMLDAEIAFADFKAKALVSHRDGDRLEMCGHRISCTHTPGHSPGSTCFHLEEMQALITGDTLFVGGCGRCDLTGGDPHAMHASLHKIVRTFSPATRIYPGHDYGKVATSTLQEELDHNAYLRAPSQQDFVRDRMAGTHPPVSLQARLPAWVPTR